MEYMNTAMLTMKDHLKILIDSPEKFAPQHTSNCIKFILLKESTAAQTGAFITALRMSGKDNDPQHINAILNVVTSHTIPVAITGQENGLDQVEQIEIGIDRNIESCDAFNDYIDLVGTGGDGLNTFNVSTCASILLSAVGLKVTKKFNQFILKGYKTWG